MKETGAMKWRHTEGRQPCDWSEASVSQEIQRIAGKYQRLERA